jgi:hypothetical protein
MSYKKFIAIAMSAVMMFGGSITAFAANEDTDASGTVTGTGTTATQEGFVDTTVTKVLLPLQATVQAGLAFKIDPQRLIQETDYAAYDEDISFPDKATDTGVYFQTDTKKYENVSNEFWVANRGTGDVTFTITGQLIANSDASKDIAVGSKTDATAAAPTAAKLYMGMLIGKDPTAVQLSTTATAKKVVLAADAENFEFTYDSEDEEYKYGPVASPKWNGVPIKFEGAVAKYATAADATVPKLSLTYAWAAKTDGDSTDSGITTDKCDDTGKSSTARTLSLVAETGNLRYIFEEGDRPTGELTAVKINDTARPATVTNRNITYNASNGYFVINKVTVDNTDIGIVQGSTTVVATIGGTDYTFTY